MGEQELMEINDIIKNLNNIPLIYDPESTDEEEQNNDQSTPVPKKNRNTDPDRRLTSSRSFTSGTGVANGEVQVNLSVERPSRATSASPTGAFPRTSSPSDSNISKNIYREAILRESIVTRTSFLNGKWLREIVALRRSQPPPSSPPVQQQKKHGKKRRNTSTDSYDSSVFSDPTSSHQQS